jgi:hypothetical protein
MTGMNTANQIRKALLSENILPMQKAGSSTSGRKVTIWAIRFRIQVFFFADSHMMAPE